MREPKMAALVAAGLGLGVAGCASGSTPGATVTGTVTPSSTASSSAPATGTVAGCVVGEWRSSALSLRTGGDRASASLSGGSDVVVRVAATGAVTLDFTAMKPATFVARVGDAEIRGQFRYTGTATGTITTEPGTTSPSPTSTTPTSPASTTGTVTPGTTGTPSGTPTGTPTGTPGVAPSDATSGPWRPVGDLNWAGTRVTVDLTKPVRSRPFNNVPLEKYLGDDADRTDVVDIDPFFDEGRYTCQGDQLTVTPDDDSDIAWALTRV